MKSKDNLENLLHNSSLWSMIYVEGFKKDADLKIYRNKCKISWSEEVCIKYV